MLTNTYKSPSINHYFADKDGKKYLVVPSVPFVEGVLNNNLVTLDEVGKFYPDWNGMPIVLRHPQKNNGSARVPNPDVPIIGTFYNAVVDEKGKKLKGEYWFDVSALLTTSDGTRIYNSILKGEVVETSTGYYADLVNMAGEYNGISYTAIQQNIHPDHIAVLPDEIGACSVKDGCGVNRNSATKHNCSGCILNITGNLPEEAKEIYEKVYKESIQDGDDEETASKKAWAACKRAGYKKEGDEWVKKNYAMIENAQAVDYSGSSMIAYMLPETIKEKIKAIYPEIEDEIYDNLHITLAFLGETQSLDMVKALKATLGVSEYQNIVSGQVQGVARFISGGELDAVVLTFDSKFIQSLHSALSGELTWRGVELPSEHGFIPHITIAYIGKDEEMPIDTLEPFDLTIDSMSFVNGDSVLLTIPLNGYVIALNTKAPSQSNWLVKLAKIYNEEIPMKDEFKTLLNDLAKKEGFTLQFNDEEKTLTATPTIKNKSVSGLEAELQKIGGVEKFGELLVSLSALPSTVASISETVQNALSGISGASELAKKIAADNEKRKGEIVARLLTNERNPFDESALKAMPVDQLEKLESSYSVTSYAALGGGSFVRNASVEDEVLPLPEYVVAEE